MKKFLSMLVALTLVLSALAIVPVQAATIEKDIVSGVTPTTIYNTDTTYMTDADYIPGYDASMMTDGDDSTYAIIKKGDNSNHITYFDLGEVKDLNSIKVVFADKADAKVVQDNSSLSTSNDDMHVNTILFASTTQPSISHFNYGDHDNGGLSTAGIAAGVKSLDRGSMNNTTKEITSNLTGVRYVGVYSAYSYGMAIKEFEVYADVEVGDDEVEIVEQEITGATVAAGMANGMATGAGYNTDKMVDDDETTFGMAGAYWGTGNGLRTFAAVVIDLGKPYKLSEVTFKTPAYADIAEACKSLPNYIEGTSSAVATDRWNYSIRVYASTAYPTAAPAAADITASLGTYEKLDITNVMQSASHTWDASAKLGADATENEYQYIVVSSDATTAIAYSDIVVKGMVAVPIEPEPTPGEGETVIQVEEALTGFEVEKMTVTANSTTFAPLTGYEPEKAWDGQDDTFALIKNLEVYSSYSAGSQQNLFVIDLGKQYDLTEINVKAPVTTDVQTAIRTSNPTWDETAKPMNGRWEVNYGTYIGVSNTVPSISDIKTATTELVGNADISNGRTWLWSDTEESTDKYQYISFYVSGNSGIGISELTIKAMVDKIVPAGEEVVVSRNKAVFATGDSTGSDNAFAERFAVDGDTDTAYAGVAYREDLYDDDVDDLKTNFVSDFDVVIDLGAQVPVSKIEFTPYNPSENSGDIVYTIGGTNDYATTAGMPEPEITTLATYTGAEDDVKLTQNTAGSYRFVVVNVKNSGDVDSVIAGIRELDVYSTADPGVADVDTSMTRISRGKTSYSDPLRWGELANITDGQYSLKYATVLAKSGEKNHFIVDLGAEYPISAINLMQIKGNSGFGGNITGFEIIATNTEVNSENISDVTYDTLASGLSFKNTDILKLMYVPIESEETYRYVGVRGISGMHMPFREFDVWTTAEAASEVDVLRYTIANGTDITYEMSAENAPEGTYNVIVASYDSNGVLTKVDTSTTISTIAGSADIVNNKISGSITGAAVANAAKVKVFVMNLSNLCPLTTTVRAN